MRGFRPRRMRVQSRILLYTVSLLVGAVALMVFVVDYRKTGLLMDLSQERGLAIANSLAAASSQELLTYNYVALQQLADRAVKEEGLGYVIVLDKEGVVAGYDGRPDWQGRRIQDMVNNAAVASRQTLIQKLNHPSLGPRPGFDISVPVYVEGSPQKWGTVRIGLSLDSVYTETVRTRLAILGLGVVVLALAFVVARELSRRITGPLGRLMEATDELAKGNFDVRVGLTTGDEIEYLSTRFDGMARELRHQQAQVEDKNRELAAFNASLEGKVVERTRALAEAEEKYRILVEFSPDPICIFQGDRLVFFNHALCRTFGYTQEELSAPDFDLLRLIEEDHQGTFQNLLDLSSAENGEDRLEELIGRHKDGSAIHLDFRSTRINYYGKPALEAIMVDVTSQRQLQDQIVSNERLRALGEMASGVAHDFNNILGTILARAQLLQRKAAEPEVIHGLQIIEKAATDGGETVKRIQDFSRVRTDRNFVPVNLGQMIDDVIELTRNTWQDEAQRQGKRIGIAREVDDGACVDGNEHELREVLMNLVLNAVDALTEDGTITLGARMDGDTARVTVTDTGSGMTEEVQRRLFDPFFSTKGVKGTGLGMSIVYGIVTRHGGKIEVQTVENEGTSFVISLPASEEQGVPLATGPASELLVGVGRVLVVDDEEAIRTLAAEILLEGGYEVETASDGPDAVARMGRSHFDLLLTDLGMPDMSGWEVARACRERRPGIRVLLLTGWGATLDPAEVRRSGIDRTMQKPFHLKALLTAVHELLDGVPLRKSA